MKTDLWAGRRQMVNKVVLQNTIHQTALGELSLRPHEGESCGGWRKNCVCPSSGGSGESLPARSLMELTTRCGYKNHSPRLGSFCCLVLSSTTCWIIAQANSLPRADSILLEGLRAEEYIAKKLCYSAISESSLFIHCIDHPLGSP